MSVIRACIERFRSQEPLPPQARDKFLSREDFWWNSNSNSPDNTPTPSLAVTSYEAPVEHPTESNMESSRDISQELTIEEGSISSEDQRLSVTHASMLTPNPRTDRS